MLEALWCCGWVILIRLKWDFLMWFAVAMRVRYVTQCTRSRDHPERGGLRQCIASLASGSFGHWDLQSEL